MDLNEKKFVYITNNTYKPEFEKQNSNSAKDGLDVMLENYLFSRHRVNKNSINWLCKHSKCPDEKIIRYVGHHVVTEFEVDKTKKGWEKLIHVPLSQTDLQVLEFTSKCKLRAIIEDTPYFVDTYFEGDFHIKSWNHFETDGPRTNNNMEGYNSKLKKHVGTAHPNIHKAIEFFQQEEVL